MKKEKGHGSWEGGGAFMSNTNYMKTIVTMIREGTWCREGGGTFMTNTNHCIEISGLFRLGVGAKASYMSHVACKWAPKAINKKVT
jgi:hypothetical protein